MQISCTREGSAAVSITLHSVFMVPERIGERDAKKSKGLLRGGTRSHVRLLALGNGHVLSRKLQFSHTYIDGMTARIRSTIRLMPMKLHL